MEVGPSGSHEQRLTLFGPPIDVRAERSENQGEFSNTLLRSKLGHPYVPIRGTADQWWYNGTDNQRGGGRLARPGKRLFAILGAILLVVVVGAAVGAGWGIHRAHSRTGAGNASNVSITVSSPETVSQYRTSTIYDITQRLLANPPQKKLDASGFVQYVFAQAGIQVPRTVQQQSQTGTPIVDASKLRKGDVVFFSDKPADSKVTFDGIYMGDDQVAALTLHGIQTFQLNDAYWSPLFRFGVMVSQ